MAHDLTALLDLMKSQKNFSSGVPATADQVRNIESALGIVLPESYSHFLKTYGWARWFGRSVYGCFPMPERPVGHDVDTIRKTLKVRNTTWPPGWKSIPIKGNVLYFSNEVIFLNSADSERPGVVIDLDYDEGEGAEAKSWPSFDAYLAEILKN